MKMTKFVPALLGLFCIGATVGLNGLTVGLNGHNVETDNNFDGKFEKKPLVKEYGRFLELTHDENFGPNFVPPTVDQLVAAVLDPNHQYAIASGFYDAGSVLVLRQNAIDYMRDTYCLDFAGPNATVDPATGIITLALPNPSGPADVFLMLPYTSQNATEIHVAFDSANPKRGKRGDWYGYQYGELVVPAQSGVLCDGQRYKLGDTLVYFHYNLMNSPIPKVTRKTDVEVLTLITNFVSLDVVNSQTYSDSLTKVQVIDEDGNVGFGLENILFYKEKTSGDVYTRTRVELTWDKE